MSCTKIFSKTCILLLTFSFMSLGFSSEGEGPLDGEKLGGIGSQIINATQKDYNTLFKLLYDREHPGKALTVKQQEAITREFNKFFTRYPNEKKEDSASRYLDWTCITQIIADSTKTPAWENLFFQFINSKDENLINESISNALSQIAKQTSRSEVYIPPNKRKLKSKLRDQPLLTTPHDIPFNFVIPDTRVLREYVMRDVIGQDEAISSITMDICDHFIALRRNQYIQEHPDEAREKKWVTIPKKNMLVIGESGSGKTKTFEVIDQYFKENNTGINVIKLNTSGLVSSGYRGGYTPTEIGEIIFNAVLDLSKKDVRTITDADIENALKRIIVRLDEFDKIRITGNDDSGVTNIKVQNELLPYFDEYGKILEVEREIEPHVKRTFTINTKNVLFIAMGAFAELTLEKREEDCVITTEEIIRYGFLPEIVGRLPILTTYKPHTTESLTRILKESRNSRSFTELCQIPKIG